MVVDFLKFGYDSSHVEFYKDFGGIGIFVRPSVGPSNVHVFL